MPAFNEEATIERAIERVLEADLGVDSYELLVVENGSLDSTRRVLTEREWPAEVKLIFVDRNRGKGDAIRRALPQAAGTSRSSSMRTSSTTRPTSRSWCSHCATEAPTRQWGPGSSILTRRTGSGT